MKSFSLWLVVIPLVISAAILAVLEIGWRIGRSRQRRDPNGVTAGTGAIDGAIFGLMGLLLAFTFTGAASRFDDRTARL